MKNYLRSLDPVEVCIVLAAVVLLVAWHFKPALVAWLLP